MNTSTKISNDRKQEKRMHRSLNLAYIYLKNCEYAEAEKCAREYVSQESNDRGHKLLGDILRAQGKRDDALAEYEKSLQLNPVQEDVLSLVSDLITPDITNCDRLALWAARAAKSGFLEVADKFRRSVDAAKSSSFSSDSKLNRLLKEMAASEKASPQLSDAFTNGSPANLSRVSLDSVDYSFSGMNLKSLPSPVKNVQQENTMKSSTSHTDHLKSVDSGKVLESNATLLRAIGENKQLIQSFKKTVDVVLKELKDLKLCVKQIESQQNEAAESQKKLLDAFQTFQNFNEDEEYETGEYEDYGENYERENTQFSQPLPNQTPLNVTSLPNFAHLKITPNQTSVPVVTAVPNPAQAAPVLSSLLKTPAADPVKAPTTSAFSFGLKPAASASSSFEVAASQPSSIFGQNRQTFGSAAAADFKFGSAEPFKFSFGQPAAVQNPIFGAQTASTEAEQEDGDDDSHLEEEADVHFQPVIELPPQVDVVLGEEDEDQVFVARSKVYRFVNKEWKERGIGEMKVLFNPMTQKSRLLMRREQVLKVIVNHLITPDLIFKPFSGADKGASSCYQWSALNASDGPPEPEVLAVRFKTPELAQHFLDAVQNCKTKSTISPLKSQRKQSDPKEVEVVFEKSKPTSDLVHKAESLKLPSNFFNYLDKEDCPGCRGCENEQTEPVASPAVTLFAKPSAPVATTAPVPAPKPSDSVLSPPKSILGPSKLQTSSLDSVSICTPSNTKPASTSSSSVFSTPVLSFGSPAPVASTSVSTPTSSVTSTPVGGSVFGSLSLSSKPAGAFVFGGFGNQSSTSVFGTPDSTPAKSSTDVKTSLQNGASTESDQTVKPAFSFLTAASAAAANNVSPAAPVFGSSSSFGARSEKSSETAAPVTFGFKVPENSGSGFFAGAAADGNASSGFSWGNNNEKASWMTSAPAPIFGQKAAVKSNGKTGDNEEEEEGDDGGEDEEYDPQYAPIIEMPNLVDVTTGEEDEEVMYCQRAKLFRFDKASKSWKERGLGDLKILKHRSKPRFRIVLRREQVHKIACNHYLTKEMRLVPMNNSETAVCWFAMDFAEEEAAEEQFAARFKSVELVKAFRDKFESLQQQLP